MSVELRGFDELENILKELDFPVQKKVLRKVMRKSARPTLDKMQEGVNTKWGTDTGVMRESVKLRVSTPKKAKWADIVASVGIVEIKSLTLMSGTLPAPLRAWWLEFGTQPHALGKKARVSSGKYQDQGLQHPGITPTPVIRPALDDTVDNTVIIQKEELGKEIDKAWARANR